LKNLQGAERARTKGNKGKSKVTDMAEANLTENNLLNTGKME